MAWGKIDDESFAEAEKMIGVPLRRNEWRWFEEASKDAIRHYCTGYGEDNPLYLDPEYGKKSVWKGTIAPPTFLYAIDAIYQLVETHDHCQAMLVGTIVGILVSCNVHVIADAT